MSTFLEIYFHNIILLSMSVCWLALYLFSTMRIIHFYLSFSWENIKDKSFPLLTENNFGSNFTFEHKPRSIHILFQLLSWEKSTHPHLEKVQQAEVLPRSRSFVFQQFDPFAIFIQLFASFIKLFCNISPLPCNIYSILISVQCMNSVQ